MFNPSSGKNWLKDKEAWCHLPSWKKPPKEFNTFQNAQSHALNSQDTKTLFEVFWIFVLFWSKNNFQPWNNASCPVIGSFSTLFLHLSVSFPWSEKPCSMGGPSVNISALDLQARKKNKKTEVDQIKTLTSELSMKHTLRPEAPSSCTTALT